MTAIEKHSDILVLIIVWAICLYTLQIDLSTHSKPRWEIVGGYIAVISLTILRIFKMGGLKAILATVLFLGSCYFFQIVHRYNSYRIARYFFSIYYSFYPEDTPKYYYDFWFEPICFSILWVFILLNSRIIWNSLRPSRQEEITEESVGKRKNKNLKAGSTQEMEKYYAELKEKDDEFLQNILATKIKWQKEYILAAEKILNERIKN